MTYALTWRWDSISSRKMGFTGYASESMLDGMRRLCVRYCKSFVHSGGVKTAAVRQCEAFSARSDLLR